MIFDGVCKICSFGVATVLKHDRDGVFDFAFAQGTHGAALKRAHGMDESLDTVTVIVGARVYIKSDAARALRMSRTTLIGKMKRLGIQG